MFVHGLPFVAMSFASFYKGGLPSLIRQVKKIKRGNVPKFYAVAVGRRTGIYRSWPSCKVQVDGIANAKYRRFDDHLEAMKYIEKTSQEIPLAVQNYSLKGVGAKHDVVYTDGSCWRNGMEDARAGIGVFWPNGTDKNISKMLPGKATSIRAELLAVTTALKMAKKRNVNCLTIYTDSHFVIQTATVWLRKWKENGWKTSSGETVKNKEDMVNLDRAIGMLDRVIWRNVSAHTGIKGNEEADSLANNAIAVFQKKEMKKASATDKKNIDSAQAK